MISNQTNRIFSYFSYIYFEKNIKFIIKIYIYIIYTINYLIKIISRKLSSIRFKNTLENNHLASHKKMAEMCPIYLLSIYETISSLFIYNIN